MLSYGGRAVLINQVLQGMNIHLLSALNLPIGVIRKLHSIFAKFFWKNTTEKKSRHWVSWDTLCLPKYKGGVGFRSVFDVSNALFSKLWWNLRSKPSPWGLYHIFPEPEDEEIEVCQYADSQGWIQQKLKNSIPEEYVQHILKNIPPPNVLKDMDRLVWMLKQNENFTVKSAWEYIRQKEVIFESIWGKTVPFKMAFFIWRA